MTESNLKISIPLKPSGELCYESSTLTIHYRWSDDVRKDWLPTLLVGEEDDIITI